MTNPAPAPSPQNLSDTSHLGGLVKKRVMIFDDNSVSLLMAFFNYQDRGYDVIPVSVCEPANLAQNQQEVASTFGDLGTAHCVCDKEGLEKLLRDFPPVAVLTDNHFPLKMPAELKNGEALIHSAKKLCPNIPYVLMSADFADETIEQKPGYITAGKLGFDVIHQYLQQQFAKGQAL